MTGLVPQKAFAFMELSNNSGADLSDSAAIRTTSGATIALSVGTPRPSLVVHFD